MRQREGEEKRVRGIDRHRVVINFVEHESNGMRANEFFESFI